jgi:hypothetical protein
MDDSKFDELTRVLAVPSRRSLFAAMATAIGAALFGDETEDEALAKRNNRKRNNRKRNNRKRSKRKQARMRSSDSRDRLGAEGRKKKKKKKRKKKPAANAPAATAPPTAGCTPTCAGKSCGASDGCGGTCQTGSCPGGQVCQQGQCVSSCNAGSTLCGSQCVDTQTNGSHCGGCDQPCAVEAPETCGTNGQCVGGVCQQYGTETVCRHESCLDSETLLSEARCGGGRCASSLSRDCRPGQCDSTLSSDAMCRDFCYDGFECSSDGWCDGNQCHFKRDNGQPCSASTPQMCASGFCVDGICCENACNAPPNAQRTCAGGTCGFVCGAGWDNCDGDPANGCETNLSSDDDHCGTCGNRCPITNCSEETEPRFWACVEGTCQCVI